MRQLFTRYIFLPMRIPFLWRSAACAAVVVFPHLVAAQAKVSGVVTDSLANSPLARATVQLIARDDPSRAMSTESDSSGRFAFDAVPVGRYRLGFFHEILDSLGIEAPLKEVAVTGTAPVTVQLGIPSASRLRRAMCGAQATDEASAVITGSVRDAKGAPAAGVTVAGDWFEYSIVRGGMSRRLARRTATTNETGFYALCDVPSGGVVAVVANKGSDSTGTLEVNVPANGFLRHEIYLGRANTGHISGTVTSAIGFKPLANATVSVIGGPQVRTNERGEFTITNAPEGTRMVEVRALGFYPDRRHVNIVEGAGPVRFTLSTLKAVLDTVKIRASRLALDEGFTRRVRMGQGKFIGPEEVVRANPINTTDLFRRLPGVRMDSAQGAILVRGAFDPTGYCEAAVFIDGKYMRTFTGEDIDDYVPPKNVAGIEVYSGAFVPAEFQVGLSGCGAIVIWTK